MSAHGSSAFSQFLQECGVTGVEVRGSGDGPMEGDGLSAPLAWEVWEVLVPALKCLPISIVSEFPQKEVTGGCWEWLWCWDRQLPLWQEGGGGIPPPFQGLTKLFSRK